MKVDKINKLYFSLLQKHGRPEGQWKLWCKRPKTLSEKEEVIIGAILTQRTNWKNVELAINNLKKRKVNSMEDIYRLGPDKLAFLIKPSGFYQIKAKYLFGLAQFIVKNYGNLQNMEKQDFRESRKELLELKGVGPETADSILLYALEKQVFVIDEYTRRLARKNKLSQDLSYHSLQSLFERNLKKDWRLYQDFHALIVIDGKNTNALAGNRVLIEFAIKRKGDKIRTF